MNKTSLDFCKQFESSYFAIYALVWTSKQMNGGFIGLRKKHPGSGNVPRVNEVTWVLLTYQVLHIFEKCHSLMENKAAEELLGCLHHQTCSTLSGSSHHPSVQCREMEFPALQSICKPAPGAGEKRNRKESEDQTAAKAHQFMWSCMKQLRASQK